MSEATPTTAGHDVQAQAAGALGGAGTLTSGGALLSRMKALGVDYIFANSGTDFPPVIEGLAEAEAKDIDMPQAIIIPHESAAMGMAHGYYLATGKIAAVMAHTNVGLANCAIGAINAAVENIPMMLFSGRTPTTEKGRFGARTVPIGWGQEMRDQTALVREACKWDYELRFPEQAIETVDRAKALAETTPRGPVYVSLPREVLCEPCPADEISAPAIMTAPRPGVDQSAVDQAAEWIATAKAPVIFAQRGAGGEDGFAALADLTDRWGIPVCQYWAVRLALDLDHPMAAGNDPADLLENADVVLVIDSLAPWAPDKHKLKPGCKVIHLAQDPLFSKIPVRNFQCDLALSSDVEPGLQALSAALNRFDLPEQAVSRHAMWAERNAKNRQAVIASSENAGSGVITKNWVSLCLSRALEGRKASILSELGCPPAPMTLNHPAAWYQEPHAGGLGWSFPAALGMKLGDPERRVIATMGDGSYMFSNPVVCHQIAEALELPILVIILNNAEWGAVRQSVLDHYPDGYAARANRVPLTQLSPAPDFTQVARASRAYAARVDQAGYVENAIKAALDHIEHNKTLALLDVAVSR
jgi:acetolactate synthase-1/2/3 large subunit